MTTKEMRNKLQTDKSLDAELATRALGLLGGDWTQNGRSIAEWHTVVSQNAPPMRQQIIEFVLSLVKR